MGREPSKQEFAVIVLGRFGTVVARTLLDHGCMVLGIDRRAALVVDKIEVWGISTGGLVLQAKIY